MTKWQPISTAPRDGTPIIVLTADGYAIEAEWDAERINFWKSQEGAAAYDPENALGEWITLAAPIEGGDCRMYCGMTPKYWMPKQPEPPEMNG